MPFNRFLKFSSTPVTSVIVWSAVGVYLLQLYYAKVLHSDALLDLLVCSRETFETGSYWQLITYAWVHSPDIPISDTRVISFPLHLLVNMLMINALGRGVEATLGSLKFLFLYLGSVLAAVIAFFLFSGEFNEAVMGASGAAFGLLASLAVLYPRDELHVLLFFVIPAKLKVRTLAAIACGFELFCALLGWLPFISHSAHLGGALFGFLFTLAFKPQLSFKEVL